MARIITNINKPAPRWYRVFNRIYGPTETTVLSLALILGYSDMSKEMLIFKLASSYIRLMLEAILVESTQQGE